MVYWNHAARRALMAAMLLQAGGALANCIATHNDGGTVQNSVTDDASALRAAIALATSGGTVKVAGHCQGAILDGGTTQVARISQAITLVGGYPTAVLNWATSDPVANPTILDGQSTDRVLLVNSTGTVTLRNLTVTNSHNPIAAPNDGAGARLETSTNLDGMIFVNNSTDNLVNGAGVFMGGVGNTFTVANSRFENNTAGGQGGGIYILAENNQSVSVADSIFIGNQQASAGGGLTITGNAATATLTVDRTRFENNSADADGSGGAMFLAEAATTVTDSTCVGNSAGYGGGCIYMAGDATLTLRRSTLYDNTANVGGALRIQNETNSAVIENSTFSNNQAVESASPGGTTPSGGAIEVYIGTLTVRNSTFSGNGASGTGAVGGTLTLNEDGPPDFPHVTLYNTIMANSTGSPACYSSDPSNVLTLVGSMIEDGSCGTAVSPDPQLGPLQNNGGLTLTMLPAGNSPLLDAGNLVNCLATDQRGITRYYGAGCDIGAVEIQANGGPHAINQSHPVPLGGMLWWLLSTLGLSAAGYMNRRGKA